MVTPARRSKIVRSGVRTIEVLDVIKVRNRAWAFARIEGASLIASGDQLAKLSRWAVARTTGVKESAGFIVDEEASPSFSRRKQLASNAGRDEPIAGHETGVVSETERRCFRDHYHRRRPGASTSRAISSSDYRHTALTQRRLNCNHQFWILRCARIMLCQFDSQ
jgi:hypothetical protein